MRGMGVEPGVHPGEVLLKEFLEPLGMSADDLAQRLGVEWAYVDALLRCEDQLTPDLAFRLGAIFRTTPDFWLNLQHAWDVSVGSPSPLRGGDRGGGSS